MNKIKRNIVAFFLSISLTFSSFTGSFLNPISEVQAIAVVDDAAIIAVLMALASFMGYKFVTSAYMQEVWNDLLVSQVKGAHDLVEYIRAGGKKSFKAGSDLLNTFKEALDAVVNRHSDDVSYSSTSNFLSFIDSAFVLSHKDDFLNFIFSKVNSSDVADLVKPDNLLLICSVSKSDFTFNHSYNLRFLFSHVSNLLAFRSDFYSIESVKYVCVDISFTITKNGDLDLYHVYFNDIKSFPFSISGGIGSGGQYFVYFRSVPILNFSSLDALTAYKLNGIDATFPIDNSSVTTSKDITIPEISSEEIANQIIERLEKTKTNSAVGSIDYAELSKAIADAVASAIPSPTSASSEASTEVSEITGKPVSLSGLFDFLYGILQKILDGILSIPTKILESLKSFKASVDSLGDRVIGGIKAAPLAIEKLLQTVIDGIKSISGVLADIKDAVIALPASIAASMAKVIPSAAEKTVSDEDSKIPGLADVFPFCIPFDLIAFIRCLKADPEAPHFTFPIKYPKSFDSWDEYELDIDLSSFDSIAELVRKFELLIFCIALVLITRDHMIKG